MSEEDVVVVHPSHKRSSVLISPRGVLGIVGVLAIACGSYAAARYDDGKQEEQIKQNAEEIKAVETRSKERTDALQTDIRTVNKNLTDLMMALGVKPKEQPQ